MPIRRSSRWCRAACGTRLALDPVRLDMEARHTAVERGAQRSRSSFVFTIDVESRTDGGPESDIWGRIPGEADEFGVTRIMDILEAQGIYGTFFLNVYELAKHGEREIGAAASIIHARGHDLELHTHPRPMYGFYGMANAPLADQVKVMHRGVEILQQWTGKRVLAHRAGAFSANLDTVKAAELIGLEADCSLSAGSRVRVPLVRQLGASNLVRQVGKVWEIPVTYYTQLRFGPWRPRRILDIEGSSLSEIKYVVRWSLRRGLPTICILMHSFSLCRHGKPNRRAITRFTKLLAWLKSQSEVDICTIAQVCERLRHRTVVESAVGEPNTGIFRTWLRSVVAWNEGWRNFLTASVGVAAAAVLIFVLVYACRVILA